MLIVGGVFAAVLAIVLGAYWFFVLQPEQSEEHALRKRLHVDSLPANMPKRLRLTNKDQKLSEMSAFNAALLRASRITNPLQRSLTQAGMETTVGTIFLAAGCLALGAYVVVRMLFFNTPLAIGAGVVASLIPFLVVNYKKNKRLGQFEEQFPEAIDLIARALRAGHAFTTGLSMVSEEIPKPVGEEFKLLYDRQNFGMPLPEAMKAFADRMPLIDARFFVTAVLTQRETGGNLGEVLDNLASVIRDRFRVKRQVRVLTAHGRITGWILAAMPPALAAVMFVIAPGHMMMLINDPLGVQMIVGALVLQVIGTLTIRKLVDIPY
jgi:tight adherence protein B